MRTHSPVGTWSSTYLLDQSQGGGAFVCMLWHPPLPPGSSWKWLRTCYSPFQLAREPGWSSHCIRVQGKHNGAQWFLWSWVSQLTESTLDFFCVVSLLLVVQKLCNWLRCFRRQCSKYFMCSWEGVSSVSAYTTILDPPFELYTLKGWIVQYA